MSQYVLGIIIIVVVVVLIISITTTTTITIGTESAGEIGEVTDETAAFSRDENTREHECHVVELVLILQGQQCQKGVPSREEMQRDAARHASLRFLPT